MRENLFPFCVDNADLHRQPRFSEAMKQLRSIGVFLITCAVICGLIAYERYATAKSTAIAVANSLEGVEFVAVDRPLTTMVAGAICIVLSVAGIKCVADSFRETA